VLVAIHLGKASAGILKARPPTVQSGKKEKERGGEEKEGRRIGEAGLHGSCSLVCAPHYPLVFSLYCPEKRKKGREDRSGKPRQPGRRRSPCPLALPHTLRHVHPSPPWQEKGKEEKKEKKEKEKKGTGDGEHALRAFWRTSLQLALGIRTTFRIPSERGRKRKKKGGGGGTAEGVEGTGPGAPCTLPVVTSPPGRILRVGSDHEGELKADSKPSAVVAHHLRDRPSPACGEPPVLRRKEKRREMGKGLGNVACRVLDGAAANGIDDGPFFRKKKRKKKKKNRKGDPTDTTRGDSVWIRPDQGRLLYTLSPLLRPYRKEKKGEKRERVGGTRLPPIPSDAFPSMCMGHLITLGPGYRHAGRKKKGAAVQSSSRCIVRGATSNAKRVAQKERGEGKRKKHRV